MKRLIFPLALLALCGCRTVPISGRTQLMLSSQGDENALGAQAFGEVRQKIPASKNAAQNQSLARVGAALKNVTPDQGFVWEFVVLDNNEANAFCLPGGRIGVYSGLFSFVDNDAELAVVVAHEIAHAIARHGGERMSWSLLQTLGLWGLSYGTESETLLVLYGAATDVGVLLPFSRSNEREADNIGLTLTARAGYDPNAALHFWQKFGGGRGQSAIEVFLSTHPGGAERIEELKKAMPEAVAEYQRAANKKGFGNALR